MHSDSAWIPNGDTDNAVNFGGAAMSFSKRSQILGSGLKKSTLRIEHFQKIELPEFIALGCCIVGTLRAWQNFQTQYLRFLTADI